MINRISEIPLWGPEEQIRKFIHMVDIPSTGGTLTQTLDDGTKQEVTQQEITQQRIANLDEIFQKQLISPKTMRIRMVAKTSPRYTSYPTNL